MSNFEFITNEWPGIHADCVRAESYLSTDPAAACFYSRRAIEQLVGHLYDVMAGGAVPQPTWPLASVTQRSSRRSASGWLRS